MARKRKTRATETAIEPEPVQLSEGEPEKSVTEEPETLEDDPVVGEGGLSASVDEVQETETETGEGGFSASVEEEQEVEEGEGEGEGEGEEEDVPESGTNDLEGEVVEKPSENVASENGGESDDQNEEDEGELEDEPLEKILELFTKDQLTCLLKEAADQNPDVLEIVNKLADADPSHRKIFVHGLGWDANSDLVTSVFAKYGEIEDCKVVMDKLSGKAKGYAFILYKHRDGSRRALKNPQKSISGRMTSCQLASAGPVQAPPPVVTPVSVPAPSEYTQRKIYVSNVSADIDVKKLVEYFSKFGEIEEGPLGLDKETGKPRGFCLFVYKSVESAKMALDEPHKNLEGQILHCQKAVDGPKVSKGSFNPQSQQRFPNQSQNQLLPRHQGQQGHYHTSAKRGKYGGGRGGMGHTGGHLMAPSAGSVAQSMGYNPAVPPAAIGQAVAALLATQGAGLGIGNLLGGIGAGVNPQGGPALMNSAVYGGQGGTGSYGQPGMQFGYGGQQHMGQGGVRPHMGGAPYRGHGH